MGAGGGTQKDQQNTKQLEKYLLMSYIRTEMEKVYRKEKENANTVRMWGGHGQ